MRVNVIRLELDCTQSQSWAEIDAVQLRGSLCFQWEPSTHHLFPQSFKSMVKEMLLINRKLNAFSQDILHEIFNIAASGWALTTADQMGSGEGLRYWPCGKHCGEVYLCKGSACGCQGGPVLGGVGMYAQESNKCSSAVHAGVISAKEGGFFRLVEIAGQLSYEQGREAYGITPLDFGPSCGSFVICKLERPLACGLSSFEFVPGVFICRGKISGCTGGVVYGTDTYSPRSNVCSAALHAGVIGLEGGSFSVAKHPNYKGEFIASVRNGIESHAAPSHKNGAFSCYALKDSSSLAQHTAEKTWADAINCGHRGGIFFFCKGIANGCPGGTIWGTGVYTSDSCVCTAALHSGAITPQGGYFSVIHASGQESYPSSTMHGISSLGYSEPWHSSIVIKPLSHNTYAPSFPSSTFMPPPSTSAGC
ncbi:cysteine-rich secretory protein LCCL domain-containing [Pelomyxa schiedti]|nr:cysteine-rich secretory protein LCCL domain-containing [Pelomyxa schiedti]